MKFNFHRFSIDWDSLLDSDFSAQERSKAVAELSIASRIVRDALPEVVFPELLKNSLDIALQASFQFGNSYVLYQRVIPYVFSRDIFCHAPSEALVDAICSLDLTSREMPPHRRTEVDYIAWKAGRRESLPTPFSCGVWGCTPRLFDFDRSSSYSLTHTLFYSTDFGGCPIQANVQAEWLEILMSRYYYEQDLDLFFECLLAFLCIEGTDFEPAVACGIKLLTETGFLASEEPFATRYHTLLVVDMAACRVAQRRGRNCLANPFLNQATDLDASSLIELWPVCLGFRTINFRGYLDSVRRYESKFGAHDGLAEQLIARVSFLRFLAERRQLFCEARKQTSESLLAFEIEAEAELSTMLAQIRP